MNAKRIQRRRVRGWKMPADTIYVGRPSRWGNPFMIDPKGAANYPDYRKNVDLWQNWPVADAETAVRAFREMCCTPSFRDLVKRLRGKNLACWCPLDRPCHADILLEIANPATPEIEKETT